MSISFTKLFSSITESTIWVEPDHVRVTWITMLAMADRKGRVWASVPGLANRARVSVENCEDSLSRFLSPDKYSRTADFDGRRIEPIDGGWRLLNYDKYRQIRDDETTRESKRNYINARRNAERSVENVEQSRTPSNQAEAEAEADITKTLGKTNGSAVASPASAKMTDADWLAELARNSAYNGLDVSREHQKMMAWCDVNRKQPTRRRFINWLNRAERPMSGKSAVIVGTYQPGLEDDGTQRF